MSTELIHQVRVSPDIDSRMIETSHNGVVTPGGLADARTTLQTMQKKDCCDYVVPQGKQPNCWQKLSPGQKKVVCCGGLFGSAGGLIGGLYGAGVISSGAAGIIGVIALCCSVKIGICVVASRGGN